MKTPTLVIHGALDYRVPDEQGLAYYNTLKARGVDARLLWFPDENHWILKPRNSKLWYGEFFDWLRARTRSTGGRNRSTRRPAAGRASRRCTAGTSSATLRPPPTTDARRHADRLLLHAARRQAEGLGQGVPDAARSDAGRRDRAVGRRVLLPGAHHAGQGRGPVRQVRPRLRRLLQGRRAADRLHAGHAARLAAQDARARAQRPRRRRRSRRWAGTS